MMAQQTSIDREQTAFRFGWGLPMTMGVVTILIGLAAISMAFVSTLISVAILGICILAAGVAQIFYTMSSRRWSDGLAHAVLAVLYMVGGYYLIQRPLSGAISLTLFLSLFYIVSGAYRVAAGLVSHSPGRAWAFFGGIVTLLLGGLILGNWPGASLWVIGLFVGVDLVLLGGQLTALAFAVHHVEKEIHPVINRQTADQSRRHRTA